LRDRDANSESAWISEVGKHPVLEHAPLMEKFRQLGDAYAAFPLPRPPGKERPSAELLRSDEAARAEWDSWEAACAPVWSARRGDPRIRGVTQEIAASNLRLVMSLARKRMRYRRSLCFMDLVAAGNEGLLTAIERFDRNRGCKFSTYATWWIRQAINRWVSENAREIRMPAHATRVQQDIDREVARLRTAGEEIPSREELAKKLGLSVKVAEAAMHSSVRVVPLDAPAYSSSESTSGTVADVTPDAAAGPFERVSSVELLELVGKVVSTLTPREEAILRLRFGLVHDTADDAGFPITASEVGSIIDGSGLTEPTDEDLEGLEEEVSE